MSLIPYANQSWSRKQFQKVKIPNDFSEPQGEAGEAYRQGIQAVETLSEYIKDPENSSINVSFYINEARRHAQTLKNTYPDLWRKYRIAVGGISGEARNLGLYEVGDAIVGR